MTIPVPQRGQPIDYNYLALIVQELNNISNKVAQRTSQSSLYSNGSMNAINTSDLVIEAANQTVTGVLGSSLTLSGSYSFSSHNFSTAPIVTITPVQLPGGNAITNVSVTITDIVNNAVKYIVTFPSNTSGTTISNFAVNIIAIGKSNA
jgi:hypothetical protein